MIKKLSFLLLFLVACSTFSSAQKKDKVIAARDIVAQQINKFLTVKGVELRPGLKMSTALDLLLQKGCTKADNFEYAKSLGMYQLVGPFFSTKDCDINILPTTYNKDVVGAIGIAFPQQDNFKDLKATYDNIKASLSNKYYLAECVEKFDDDFVANSTSDPLKLNAIAKKEAVFKSNFYVTEDKRSLFLGQVILQIGAITTGYLSKYLVYITYSTSDTIVEQITQGEDDL